MAAPFDRDPALELEDLDLLPAGGRVGTRSRSLGARELVPVERRVEDAEIGAARMVAHAANLDPDDPVEVSTNGRVVVIAPLRSKRDIERLARGQELMHAKFAGAFRRLAK